MELANLPFVRFATIIVKAFDPKSSTDKEFVFEAMKYASMVLFIVGGLTSIAYTLPTIYNSLNPYLPYYLSYPATGVCVILLFFAIDLLLSVIFPFATETLLTGKAVRNWRTAIGTIFLFCLCGAMAYISYNMSQEGGYTPALAAIKQDKQNYNPADFPNKQKKELTSATDIERMFDKRIEKLQEGEDKRLQKLIAQASDKAKSQRAWAAKTYPNNDQFSRNTLANLYAQYARDSAATVAKFKADKKVEEEIRGIEKDKQAALLATQTALVNHTEVIKTDKAVEAEEQNRKLARIQGLVGLIGSVSTLLGLLLTLVTAFMKAGLAAPPSERLFPFLLYPSFWVNWWKGGKNEVAVNQTVTAAAPNGNNLFSNSNNNTSYGNSNNGGGNTAASKIVTVINLAGGSDRMTISEANTKFHAYKSKIEAGTGDTFSHAAMCRAIYDAIDYVDSDYAAGLRKRIIAAGDAPQTISMLGW